MRLYLDGVGLLGPGLANWPQGREVLASLAPYRPAPVVLLASDLLPVAERRRTPDTVKLALAVGSEAMAHAQASPWTTRSVFASSGGDGATIVAILDVLATENREVSPTRFHNSVHNAPAGYWSIATQSREASTSLCAYDFSFSVGLLEASAQAVTLNQSVLLVSYDIPYSGALGVVRPMAGVCGMALVLSPRQTAQSLAALSIEIAIGSEETRLAEPQLEHLRAGSPTGRGLPVLAALASGMAGNVTIPYVAGNNLNIMVTPLTETRA
jgi:hypothetical protein